MSAKITKLGLFIWALASLFFLYEFFLQVFQSTVASQIMQELHIDASSYAIMTAAYFLPYSLMQIPVGILADKFGAHLLLTLSAASCSLGVFGFSLTHHFNTAVIARLFMGLGAASAYVCLLLLAMNWFPKRHFAFMIGMANLIGSTGPFLAGGPLSYLLTLFNNNWRLILLCISGSGAILAICIGLFVRNNPTRNREEIIHLDPYAEPLRIKLKKLITNKQVWNIGLVSCLLYISLPLLGAYWGTGYLQARGLSRTHAASLSSTLWIGYALGAPLIGKFSDSIKRRKTPLLISSLIGLIASIFILTPPIQNPFFFAPLFFLIGFASSGITPGYATISEHVPKNLQATSLGFNNSFITFGAAIIPPIISLLIDYGVAANTYDYTVSNFLHGLFLMPIFYALALLFTLFGIKETYCRSQHEIVEAQMS